jgi:hypothetical protein
MTVLAGLLRFYRWTLLWFAVVLLVVVTVANVITHFAGTERPAFSVLIAALAFKYWLLVLGIVSVSINLRLFVAAGITRRAFFAGTVQLAGLGAVVLALMVPIGHAVESAVAGVTPAFTPGLGLREFGLVLPGLLAAFVSGAAVSAGFYRHGLYGGAALLIPALLPTALAELLFSFDVRFLPYAVAAGLSLLVTALGVLLYRAQTRTMAIR